jgi:hypothetical protein
MKTPFDSVSPPANRSPLARDASRRIRAAPSTQLRSALSRLSSLEAELTTSRQALLDSRSRLAALSGANDLPGQDVPGHARDGGHRIADAAACIRIPNALTQGLGAEFSSQVE